MNQITARLTILFEEPFWVGIYERTCDGALQVSRQVFGAEPKEYEVYEYYLKNWSNLRFSPGVEAESSFVHKRSPKRMQREINGALAQTGVGTKARQALKLQQEQAKLELKVHSKERAEEERQRQYLLHKLKKMAKHKGR